MFQEPEQISHLSKILALKKEFVYFISIFLLE